MKSECTKIIIARSLALLLLLLWQATFAQEARPPVASGTRIRAIRITGNDVIRSEELEPIIKPYVGEEIDLSELKKGAEKITAEYRRRGYILARAYIPEQEIKDGIVEIAVLEGKVGRVIVKGNNNYSTEFIKAAFTRVITETAIRQDSLEKSLLLLRFQSLSGIRAYSWRNGEQRPAKQPHRCRHTIH